MQLKDRKCDSSDAVLGRYKPIQSLTGSGFMRVMLWVHFNKIQLGLEVNYNQE